MLRMDNGKLSFRKIRRLQRITIFFCFKHFPIILKFDTLKLKN